MGPRARALIVAILALSATACLGAPSDGPSGQLVGPVTTLVGPQLPVVQIVEGEFDGHEFTFRTLQPDEIAARSRPAGTDGLVQEALVDLPSLSCSTGCTGANYVAFSNAATGARRAITNGAAVSGTTIWGASDVVNCGAVPTSGLCQQIRMRNMYGQQLERVYADITSLTPTGMTTAVSFSAQPYTAAQDFGLNPAVANGLFRAGELGRSQPSTGGQTMWWGFTGTTPATTTITFSFLVQVRGLIVNPTQRASLGNGLLDAPASDYPARTTVAPSSVNLGISEDGRYVAFAATGTIYRKDLSTGTLTTVASGCTTASNPHLSSDGTVVVFQASGCDLTGEGSTTATPQIYAYDVNTSTMTLITRSTTGGYAVGTSTAPRVSGDGNTVVFQSASTNLMAGTPTSGRPGCIEVYRFDRANTTMYHASAVRFSDVTVPTDGWAAGCTGSSVAGIAPDVSGDGNLVVFSAVRPLDATGDTNARSDVYMYDQAATDGSGVAIVYRVSLRSTGAELTAGTAISGALSADGAYVAFSTDATNVISGQTTTASRRHVYRRSSAEGDDSTILRVTRRVDDAEPSGSTAGIPALSSTGRFVAFWSAANDLASAGSFTVPQSEVYVCDMDAPIVALQRCWVVSALQPTAAGSFATLSGSVSSGSRIGLAYPNDIDAGYVVFQGAPSTGTWGSAGGAGQQVFVGPAGDPRYQQPTVSQ